MKNLIFSLLLCLPISGLAHEGHDHSPKAKAAPHGGMLQSLQSLQLELVVEPTGLKLYPYDHNLKPLANKDLQIEATVSFPKKKQSEKVNFVASGEAFIATVDAKGSHRYILDMTLTHQGKKETAKFNVEP